ERQAPAGVAPDDHGRGVRAGVARVEPAAVRDRHAERGEVGAADPGESRLVVAIVEPPGARAPQDDEVRDRAGVRAEIFHFGEREPLRAAPRALAQIEAAQVVDIYDAIRVAHRPGPEHERGENAE